MDEQEKSEKKESSSDNGSASYINRRSQWQSSLDALVYINHLYRQPKLEIRDTDRLTGLAVLLASIATFLCLLLHNLNDVGLKITLLCDFFLGIALTIYIFHRLGILTGMTPRQAILAWQLIKAFCFVGVFVTVNLSLILSFVLATVPMSLIKAPLLH